MKFPTAIVESKSSFIYFFYPFSFDPKLFEERVKIINQHQFPGQSCFTWKPKKFPADELLFHVGNYLRSECDSLPTACFWTLNNDLRDRFGLRLNWQLTCPLGEIPFYFGEKAETGSQVFQLALFKVGVGFAIARTQPLAVSLHQWLNFTHYFRFSKGQRQTSIHAQKKTWNPEKKEHKLTDFIPQDIELAPGDRLCFQDLLTAWLNLGSLENETQWWQDIFVPGQMLVYNSIYANGIADSDIPKLLYGLQNFFNERQGDHPAPSDLLADCQPWLSYAANMWSIFTLEGGTFLAIDAPKEEFFQQTLLNHLHNQYFLLFLLALHQRFALMSLSAQVADYWLTDDATRLEYFQEIRDRLLLFTARGYFTQVMQREHHHRYYCKWQEVFQLDTLYCEVNDEIRDLHEYAQMRQNQRLELTIQVVGVAVGTGGIAASSMSGYIREPFTLQATGHIHPGVLAIGISLAIAGFFGLLTWWLMTCLRGRKRKQKNIT